MMGGFFVRFVRYLSAEEFAKLLQLAKVKTFKVNKDNNDAVVVWLLIGKHWIAGVSVGYRTTTDTQYISLCLPEAIERNSKICMDSEEKQLEPEYVFYYNTCHYVDVRVVPKNEGGYNYEIYYTCYGVERKAVFAVEVNTNHLSEHDEFVLQLVAEELASESPRTVLRPM